MGRSAALRLTMECALVAGPTGGATAVRYLLRAELGGLGAWVGVGAARGLVSGFFRSLEAALLAGDGPGAG